MDDDRIENDPTEAPHPPPDLRPPGPAFQGISDLDTGAITWIDMSPDEHDAAP